MSHVVLWLTLESKWPFWPSLISYAMACRKWVHFFCNPTWIHAMINRGWVLLQLFLIGSPATPQLLRRWVTVYPFFSKPVTPHPLSHGSQRVSDNNFGLWYSSSFLLHKPQEVRDLFFLSVRYSWAQTMAQLVSDLQPSSITISHPTTEGRCCYTFNRLHIWSGKLPTRE